MCGVLIADDHPLILRGLCEFLTTEPAFSVKQATTSGREALEQIRSGTIDIAVLDLSMPDLGGMDVLRIVNNEALKARVVFLTATITDRQIVEGMNLGVAGICLKETAPAALIDCLHRVSIGQRWLPADVLDRIGPREQSHLDEIGMLTRREKEIVELVCQGYSNKMIAIQLGSSAGTVKVHLQNVYQKLHVSNRTALAAYSLTIQDRSLS